MESDNTNQKKSILNLLQCKCPRCRSGDMFVYKNPYKLSKFMRMNDECPVCKQPFDMEVGFYYGTSFVSYAFAIAITVATFIVWWVIVGISVDDNRVFYWIAVNAIILILLQPYMMRLARTIWLAFFLRYDADWQQHEIKRPYSENKTMKDAW
ncbi:MAG: DUF983 domain-containing protein [Ferruginibacter sp.]